MTGSCFDGATEIGAAFGFILKRSQDGKANTRRNHGGVGGGALFASRLLNRSFCGG